MTSNLVALSFDTGRPELVAGFWAGVLGREMIGLPADGFAVLPNEEPGFPIEFFPTEAPRTGPNQMHLDLTSASRDDQRETVARALELGGHPIDIGQRPEEGHVVLADPDGNELCVVGPDNDFLAGTGRIGTLSCDGSRAVGHFWSEALGWPLVWDEREETAIQSPRGGSKISWGGPPVNPKRGRNRLHLDIAPSVGGDLDAEVGRLEALGATRVDIGQGDVDWCVMADRTATSSAS